MSRLVAYETDAIRYVFPRVVGELYQQPVRITAVEIGEVRRQVRLAICADAKPVGVRFDELRAKGRHLHWPDIEDSLHAGRVDSLYKPTQIGVGVPDFLVGIERGGLPHNIP